MGVSSRDSVVYSIEFQSSLVFMVTFVGNSALKISRVHVFTRFTGSNTQLNSMG